MPAPIAIIGLSCRLPGGADSPQKYWELLTDGRVAWSKTPSNRFNEEAFYHPNPENPGTTDSRGGYFLDQDVAAFDASFFGIPPIEASSIDPQQRIQLESAYEAIESAGLSLDHLRGSKTSVYIATYAHDYENMIFQDPLQIPKYAVTGVPIASASARISYLLDLKGPSLALDCGCSGSIVALHQACQSLLAGESDLAIAGGANLILGPGIASAASNLRALNKEGRVYPYDSRGGGYGRGEGTATVVIKRLDEAIRDRDPVRAIIRATAVNQDGKTNGITLPSADAQVSLIRTTYEAAGLATDDTVFLEGHGTGTIAGDTTEIEAFKRAFGPRSSENVLRMGSAKGNLGHLECASGFASLIKGVLMLEKGLVPPTANLLKLKEGIELDGTNIQIPTELGVLGNPTYSRISVHSLGYGGTNAHVIIEGKDSFFRSALSSRTVNGINGFSPHLADGNDSSEYSNGEANNTANGYNTTDDRTKTTLVINGSSQLSNGYRARSEDSVSAANGATSAEMRLFVLSARSKKSLEVMSDHLASWIESNKDRDMLLPDLTFTLAHRRTTMQWRRSLVASNVEELVKELKTHRAIKSQPTSPPQVSFVFTGQGAQWHAMGRELLFTNPVFTASIQRCAELLKHLGANWDLVEELQRDKTTSRINAAEISQPACTALQIALTDVLSNVGVRPSAVVGHSGGETAAAYAAGALSHEGSMLVSYNRGIVVGSLEGQTSCKGAMIAVGIGPGEALQRFSRLFKDMAITIACLNSPSSITVSGDEDRILELKEELDRLSIFNRRLEVKVAYHSHHMKPITDQYLQSMKCLEHSHAQSSTKFFSAVTGREQDDGFGPQYWVSNLLSPVNFSGGLEELVKAQMANSGPDVSHTNLIIEIGPHSALSAPTKQTLTTMNLSDSNFEYIPSLVRNQNSLRAMFNVAWKLFEQGYPVDMKEAISLNRLGARSTIPDMPPYPWDHESKYWSESRASKERRMRSRPFHDLLGLRLPSSPASQPSWSYIVGVDQLPWLQEHTVGGVAIISAASYLCMVIEAASQVCAERFPSSAVSNYILRNVRFLEVITVPASPSRSEIQLTINLDVSESASYTTIKLGSFVISSATAEGSWSDHCRGSVFVEMTQPSDEVDRHNALSRAVEAQDQLLEAELNGSQSWNSTQIYKKLESVGHGYGSCFANIKELKLGGHHVLSTIKTPDIAAKMPAKFAQPHVIHPVTLDSIIQTAVFYYFQDSDSQSPVVPTAVDEVTLSADILKDPGVDLQSSTSVYLNGDISALAQISAFQFIPGHERKAVIQMSNVEFQRLKGSSTSSGTSQNQEMGYSLEWKTDVENLKMTTRDLKNEPGQLTPEETVLILDRAGCIFADECVKAVSADQIGEPREEHTLFYRWLQKFSSSDYGKDLMKDLSPTVREKALQEALRIGVDGQMLLRVGSQLPDIMTGKQDALELMLRDDLLYQLYAEDTGSNRCYDHIVEYLRYLTFKNPNMRAIEIGAGTGGTTFPILSGLSGYGADAPFASYTFTDISSGFFDKTSEKLKKWSNLLTYRTLDAGRDPKEQGFELGSYDLVISANCLHATEDIKHTLSYVRSLLKPGGKLLLIETVRVLAYYNLIFGGLKSWWIGRKHGREGSPFLTIDQWDTTLQQCSFTGIEKRAYDYDGPARRGVLMVSTATAGSSATNGYAQLSIEILSSPKSMDRHTCFIEKLQASLEHIGGNVSLRPWPQRDFIQERAYILIEDASNPILRDSANTPFPALNELMTDGDHKILWITLQSEEQLPNYGLATGFARTARMENKMLRLITLDAQLDANTQEDLIEKALKILNDSLLHPVALLPPELEYRYRNGKLSIPRLLPNTDINRQIRSLDAKPGNCISLFRQPDLPLKLHVETPGLVESLVFIPDASLQEPLTSKEVKVQIEACGINFSDVLIALGVMNSSTGMAGEFAGIVTDIGLNPEHDFQVGDRVCGWGSSPYASYTRINADSVQHLPPSMPFVVAASIPVVFATAYYGLVDVARLEKGQTVLIHAGAGGVGQAAIKISQHIGATIFATVGSTAKRNLLVETFGIPEGHIFSSRTGMFKKEVLRLTSGVGVDVVLNSLSGQGLSDSWECIAPFGTFVELGKKDIQTKSALDMGQFKKNVAFASADLNLLQKLRPQKAGKLLADVLSQFNDKSLSPIKPLTTMPMTEIEEAFKLFQSRKLTGKLVLEATNDTLVKSVEIIATGSILQANGTYLIAGGLGGLGRVISQMMARRGAKHIVLLSRRSPSPELQASIREEFGSDIDARVLKCDIADPVEVKKLKEVGLAGMPPVKGIIQSTLVLKDIQLASMTAEDFEVPLRAKVLGTRVLVDTFNTLDLDFFIMLSSAVSIIGNILQANYTAANGFMDAFASSPPPNSHAHFMTLNIGGIESVGTVASDPKLKAHVERLGLPPIRLVEFFALLDYAMGPRAKADDCRQIVYGFSAASLANSPLNEDMLQVPMFSRLAHIASQDNTGADKTAGVNSAADAQERLRRAKGDAERNTVVTELIGRKISSLIALDFDALDLAAPLAGLGMDSLVYIELSTWISNVLQLQVQVAQIVESASVGALGASLASKMK